MFPDDSLGGSQCFVLRGNPGLPQPFARRRTHVNRVGRLPGRCLVLRALQSAPECGILAELFRPTLVSMQHEGIHFRWLEPLDTADGVAAVVQEWLVRHRV